MMGMRTITPTDPGETLQLNCQAVPLQDQPPRGQVLIIREQKCPCENTMHIGYIKGVGWAALTIVYL